MDANSEPLNPDAMPGLPSPSGAPPNFTHPWSIAASLKAVNTFCLIITAITTLLRIYTRLFLVKRFGWSDYTMVIAWLGFIAYQVVGWLAYPYGAGVHQWDVPITHLTSFAKIGYTSEVIYPVLIAVTKLSICLQFLNIFTPERKTKFWLLQGFIVVNMAYFLACFFVTLFQCNPRAKVWNPMLPGRCLEYQNYIFATGIFNMMSDLLMLTFPIFCIWNLQLSLSRKWGVSTVFLIGILALAASVLRVIFSFINDGSPDATFTLTQVGECTTGEIAAGIVVGNLVCLPKFFKNYGHLISSYYRSTRKSEKTSNPKGAYKESQSWPRPRNDDPYSTSRQKQDAENQAGNYVELKDVPSYYNFNAVPSNREDVSPFNSSTVSNHSHPPTFLDDEYGDDRHRLWQAMHAEATVGDH